MPPPSLPGRTARRMNDLPSWLYLIGPGGIATVLAAYFGWKSKSDHERVDRQERSSDKPSTWTIETLTEIGHDVEEVRRAVDANTKVLSDLTLQVNHIAYIFERKP